MIFSSNTPGGIVNFVSKTGGSELRGDVKYTYGTQKMYRADFNVGGPLTEDKKWRFNVGGFYRYDKGLRDFTGPANVGGQIKANITRLFDNDKGYIRFFGKVLNDQITGWSGVTYQGFDKPRRIPGGPDLLRGTFVPSENGEMSIPDPKLSTPGNLQYRRQNPANGATIKYQSVGMEIQLDLGDGWSMKNQTRMVRMSQLTNSTQVVANPTGGANLLLQTALALGGGNPANIPLFTPKAFYISPALTIVGSNYPPAARTGENIPISALGTSSPAGAFYGLTADPLGLNTNGINGNGLLLPLGMFVVDGVNTNLINNLQFSKQAGNHSLTFGGYLSQYNSDEYWSFNTILTDVRSNPRLVDLQLVAGNGTVYEITKNGVLQANFQYEQSNSKNITLAGFIGDDWKVTENITATLGFRYEMNQATGLLQNTGRRDGRSAGFVRAGSPITAGIDGTTGGLDGNPLTLFDNNADIPLSSPTNYDMRYEVWGGNIGLNFKLNENSAIFANASRGTRYATSQNFLANKDQGIITGGTKIDANNVATVGLGNPNNIGSYLPAGTANGATFAPISLRNPIERIVQLEGGYRLAGKSAGLTLSIFYSSLKDAPFTLQSTDPATGNIKLDVLLYDVRNIGGEAEFYYTPTKGLRFSGALSVQSPKYTKYPEVVIIEVDGTDAAGGDTRDIPETANTFDRYLNITNKKVERIPSVQADFTIDYTVGKFNIYANGRYIGKRQANRRNTYNLPGFFELAAGASYKMNRFTFALQGINLLNTVGILEGNNRTQDNFGPNAVKNNDLINTGTFNLRRSANFSVQYSF